MTTPYERYRAILMAEQLLKEINAGVYSHVDEIKQQAKTVLRHFPSQFELNMITQVNNQNPIFGCMLSNENPGMYKTANVVINVGDRRINSNMKQYVNDEDQVNLSDSDD